MNYYSTRDNSVSESATKVIAQGISPEGGLYLPQSFPAIGVSRLKALQGMDYQDRACDILADFLTDFTPEEIRSSVAYAYNDGFSSEKITPTVKLASGVHMLELWHGPTAAFKDLALQLLPQLLSISVAKTIGEKQVNILVATSGDTGKAALEGFRDRPGTNILVFYPEQGVSRTQKLQMTTQRGDNVSVFGVRGNFDDTQAAVKRIFTSPDIGARLTERGGIFSSANSINWGRLVPQIVYYISAYCELVADGSLVFGEKLNIAVPTGNFGNILAAYYAKRMGLPIGKLICASNMNNVLTDFITTGVYDRKREFHTTTSPSMDIIISSNLERLLHSLTGQDDVTVATLMGQLAERGVYTLPESALEQLRLDFYGGFCDEVQTAKVIKQTFETQGYLCDTHTAVAFGVYQGYREKTGDTTQTLVVSTASPFKFSGSILSALTGKADGQDEFASLRALANLSGLTPPTHILELERLPTRFDKICGREDMEQVVCESLGI